MPRKIIIEKNGVRREIDTNFGRHFNVFKQKTNIENDVKLFTDKAAMVEYVNQLTGIENVEIFKIEDSLYKVLVSRRVKRDKTEDNETESDCCHEEENKGEEK